MVSNFLNFVINILGVYVGSTFWSLMIILLSFAILLCLIKVVWVIVQSR